MSDWNYGRPKDERYEAPRPSWPDGTTYPYPLPFPLPQAVDDDEIGPAIGVTAPAGSKPPVDGRGGDGWGGDGWGGDGWGGDVAEEPVRYERDPFDTTAPQPTVPSYSPSYPWPPAPYPAGLRGPQDAEDPGDPGDGRERAGRRWLIPAALVAGGVAVGAVALVMMTGGQPGTPGKGALASPSAMPSMAVVRVSKSPSSSSSPSSPSPSVQTGAPLTLTQAQAVLANYTAANNSANAKRSDALLASIETGSSDAIDAGLYQEQQAAGTTPYPAFGPVQATYYIPGNEPATGTRWFVVQVANAFQSSPATVTSDEYLLFTQSAPGGAWQNAIEPYLLGGATPPQVEVGADGQATAVSPGAAAVAVAPGQLPATTAAALDGTGTGGASTGTAAVADPGNLADRADQRRWQTEVTKATVTDTHTAAAGADGQEFALLTADGGALVFYTDAAEVTVTPPAGSLLRLTVPGFYSASQPLTKATVSYLEQFAAYDPPAGGGAPRVVADYSGITGKN